VNARNEERSHRVDLGDIQVIVPRAADAGLECFDNFLVALKGEDQSDVDGNAVSQCFTDCPHGAIGSWDLDHRVVTAHAVPQFTSLSDGCFTVVRDARVYLDGNAPVFTTRLLIHFMQYIASIANIVDS